MSAMKRYLVLISALVSIGLVSADIQKLSNGLIRNGSTVYAFTRSKPGWFSIVFRYDVPNTHTRVAMHLFEPIWADAYADFDSTPDINVLSNLETNASRLYFSAKIVDGSAALGVATGNDVWEDWFETPQVPLLVGNADLSHPSLVQAEDGSLSLFYYNSTGPLGPPLGYVEVVPLSKDGLEVVGEAFQVLEATDEWGRPGYTSVTAFTRENMFYILYTAADRTTIGVARSRNVEGPFEKSAVPVGHMRDMRTSVRDLQMNQLIWDQHGWPKISIE